MAVNFRNRYRKDESVFFQKGNNLKMTAVHISSKRYFENSNEGFVLFFVWIPSCGPRKVKSVSLIGLLLSIARLAPVSTIQIAGEGDFPQQKNIELTLK